MKKSIYTIFVLAGLSSQAISQNKTITFEHAAFKEIKAKALKENKLIFIDAYTTWCGPCKQMAKNVFTNDTVADYYNKNFINAKIDMEKGEGIEIAKLYEVKCYPNLLFVDGKGNLIHRVAGSMSPASFIELGQDAKNPEKCFSYFSKNYEANKTNSDFLSKYIYAKDGTCLEIGDLLKYYFALQTDEQLTSEENWKMIKSFTNSLESQEFQFLIKNKERYDNLYSAAEVDEKLKDIYRNVLYSVIAQKSFDEKKYNETKAKIFSYNTPDTKQIIFESDLNLAARTKNWTNYEKLAINYVDIYYSKDANMLNNISWNFYEQVTSKEGLVKAVEWSKTACAIETSYANLDTHAAVLFKLGDKESALSAANKAIELAKMDNLTAEDYQGTTDLIKKINELK